MPAISRDKIDRAKTGHSCSTTASCIATAGSVFINGIKVLRPGDKLKPHVIRAGKYCIPHKAKINRGSRTVFAEGKPVARRGDSADQGALMKGSPNVFAG
jgi:uncharacterized Zn-binding protein involved in type VI secretion